MDKTEKKTSLERILEASTEGTNIARDPERARKLLHHVIRGNALREVRRLQIIQDAEEKKDTKGE